MRGTYSKIPRTCFEFALCLKVYVPVYIKEQTFQNSYALKCKSSNATNTLPVRKTRIQSSFSVMIANLARVSLNPSHAEFRFSENLPLTAFTKFDFGLRMNGVRLLLNFAILFHIQSVILFHMAEDDVK